MKNSIFIALTLFFCMKFAYNVYPAMINVNWSVIYYVAFYTMIISLLVDKYLRLTGNGKRFIGIAILYFLLLIGMNLLCIGNKERYDLWMLCDRSMFTIISIPSIFIIFAMGFVNIKPLIKRVKSHASKN